MGNGRWANPRNQVCDWPLAVPLVAELTVPGAAWVMSAKSVSGDVYSRMYWLVISLRGDAMSSRAFTGAIWAAIDVSASDSTITSSDTEATTSETETFAVWPTATTTLWRTSVPKPLAEVSTVSVPAS